MEEYEQFGIYKFGIELSYPAWWERKVESNDTYLFWDEYTGSFRITPLKMELPGFQLDTYLKSVEEKEKQHQPQWRAVGERKFLCYLTNTQKPDGGTTQSRYYISGEGNLVIVCSFAYDQSLLDDEFTADQLDAALEEVDLILESIQFGNF
jgi:hypothetical protein